MNLVTTTALATLFVWHVALVEGEVWDPIPVPSQNKAVSVETHPVYKKPPKQKHFTAYADERADLTDQRRFQLRGRRPVRQDPSNKVVGAVDNKTSSEKTPEITLPQTANSNVEAIVSDKVVTTSGDEPVATDDGDLQVQLEGAAKNDRTKANAADGPVQTEEDEPVQTEEDEPLQIDNDSGGQDDLFAGGEVLKDNAKVQGDIGTSADPRPPQDVINANATSEPLSPEDNTETRVSNDTADLNLGQDAILQGILESDDSKIILELFDELANEQSNIIDLLNVTSEEVKNVATVVTQLGQNVLQLNNEIGQAEQTVLILQQEIAKVPSLQTIYQIIQQIVQQPSNYPTFQQPTYQTYHNYRHQQQAYSPVQNQVLSYRSSPGYRSSNPVPVVLQYDRKVTKTRQKREDTDNGIESALPKENCVSLNQTVNSQLLLCVENQDHMGLLRSEEKKPQIKKIVTDFCTTMR